MTSLPRWLVWLSRIHHCRGFGIQSPTDYAFVRYVVNEHWPYYAYDELHEGRRQPSVILSDDYHQWFHAGCAKSILSPLTSHLSPLKFELARISIDQWDSFESLMVHCDEQTVVVVEDIWRDPQRWQQIASDTRTGTTFDLYYCGIVLFDTKRYKHNYIINF